jgi:hypothetical protein
MEIESIPNLEDYFAYSKTRNTYFCKQCANEADRIIGSPRLEYPFHAEGISHWQTDMLKHIAFHALGNDPPQFNGFELLRTKERAGDAYTYQCKVCVWRIAIYSTFYHRCHGGLEELQTKIRKHRH